MMPYRMMASTDEKKVTMAKTTQRDSSACPSNPSSRNAVRQTRTREAKSLRRPAYGARQHLEEPPSYVGLGIGVQLSKAPECRESLVL